MTTLIANANFPRFEVVVVNALPTGDDIRTDRIYLVTNSSADNDAGNVFTEYIRVGNDWEVLGQQRTALPLATTSNVGVVKIGTNVDVDANGEISVKTGSTTDKGVLQVGDYLSVSSGTVSADLSTTSAPGVVQTGDRLSVDGSGVLSADMQYAVVDNSSGTSIYSFRKRRSALLRRTS